MMSKKSPQLRFEGFTDDWEERRLSEVLRERNNQQPQSMEYPLVSFTVENGVTPKTDRYEREQLVVGDKSSKKYKVTVLNDIVYNPANLKFGAISRNKYGNAVFSPIYVTFSVNNDVTMPEFIEMLITRKDFIKRALKYQQGTVYERQSVSPENLLSMNLYLPGKLEQEKIGTFFKHLDDTISLQQRKLDLLKEQKKGYLQKMFPKNGEKIPELRFAGFADDWEERKLSSGLREYTDRVIVEDDKEYYQISVRNNFGGITLRGSKMGNKIGRKRQAKINLTKYPQTLIFTRQTVEQGGIGWVDKYCDGAIVTENMPTISLDTSVFSKYFLTNLFQTRIFYKNAILDNIEGGSAQIAIHESKFLSSTLLFPNLDEQQKIGQFFKQLDDTIDLHQRKLDLLKEQKKGFLQKMFV